MFGLLLISLKPIYYKMYGDKQILKHLIKMHEESFTSKMDSKDKTNETLIENIVSNNKIGVYDFTVIILTRCFLVFVLYSFMFGVSQLLNDILKTTIFSSIFVVFVLTLEAYPLFFRKNRQ